MDQKLIDNDLQEMKNDLKKSDSKIVDDTIDDMPYDNH